MRDKNKEDMCGRPYRNFFPGMEMIAKPQAVEFYPFVADEVLVCVSVSAESRHFPYSVRVKLKSGALHPSGQPDFPFRVDDCKVVYDGR